MTRSRVSREKQTQPSFALPLPATDRRQPQVTHSALGRAFLAEMGDSDSKSDCCAVADTGSATFWLDLQDLRFGRCIFCCVHKRYRYGFPVVPRATTYADPPMIRDKDE